MRTPDFHTRRDERGSTLAELMIALVMLSIGLLAVSQLFPAGSRGQLQSRLTTSANYYAQQEIEQLAGQSWTGSALTLGRHPDSGFDTLGTFQRFYQVDAMAAPLDNLRKVTVTVQWTFQGNRSTSSITYVRR